jgi:uncharacterized membrane protein (UPF0182 family)
VIKGNLLTLPVGGGLLYVQPVYIQAASGTKYPTLQLVTVSFGDKIGYAETLDAALNQVFGGDSGANAGDVNRPGDDPDQSGGTTSPDSGDTVTPSPDDSTAGLADALNRADQALKDSDAALKNGDWAAYGRAQAELAKAIADAQRLSSSSG